MNTGIIELGFIILLICLVSYPIGNVLANKIVKAFYEQNRKKSEKGAVITINVPISNIDKANELIEEAEIKISELKAIIEELEQSTKIIEEQEVYPQ